MINNRIDKFRTTPDYLTNTLLQGPASAVGPAVEKV